MSTASLLAPAAEHVDPRTAAWLEEVADGLDIGTVDAAAVLPALATSGLLRIGVPEAHGGAGGHVTEAVKSISAVSYHSLAAGFVLWGHRAYTEYLLQSPNAEARAKQLPELLAGRVAGATGLSNAMKFLAGLEQLQVSGRQVGDAYLLDGKLPWVTNLRPQGFYVAAAVATESGALVVSLSNDREGVSRSPDLDLVGLRATNTAAVSLARVRVTAGDIITDSARTWLPEARPAFLGLQCGMSIGLARRALFEAQTSIGAGRNVLGNALATAAEQLARSEHDLLAGLRDQSFIADPARLFRIRIELAEIVEKAAGLELQAAGGRAYLAKPGAGCARRRREATFIPIVTPSLVQLKVALSAQPLPPERRRA